MTPMGEVEFERVDEGHTLVRHDARLRTYGSYRLATPVLKRIAVRERTAVLDKLAKSFEQATAGPGA
jgi:hypothetical protein